ncbi:zwei Ig domain protein zig-8-like isoform X1 [Artemia franciscana]|uniref:zwei Ig domain protein zig-8-like isoform X1 n=1 Tax=Artemia franciscana TaxID=6661 RepID=UPI0032DB80AF
MQICFGIIYWIIIFGLQCQELIGSGIAQGKDSIPLQGRESDPNRDREGPQPIFDPRSHRNITALAGQSAYLECRVFNLGGRAVTWIRQRDLHVLTAGHFTYTTDQRFSIVQPGVAQLQGSDEEWILQIKYVQPRDVGIYECQVSTEPRIWLDFHLNVIESKAEMHGPPEVYLKQGSVFLLTCTVAQVADGTVVFWYKDGEAVDISGRNIRVDTNLEKSGPLISRLQVQQALVGDSGNYTCAPTGSISASTMVHIINGEHPAAMQHGNVARSQDNFPVLFLLLVSLFLNRDLYLNVR